MIPLNRLQVSASAAQGNPGNALQPVTPPSPPAIAVPPINVNSIMAKDNEDEVPEDIKVLQDKLNAMLDTEEDDVQTGTLKNQTDT